jgi:hypothetical protein
VTDRQNPLAQAEQLMQINVGWITIQGSQSMRKLVSGLVVVAAVALSAPAGAATIGNSGLIAALQDLSTVEQVHCVPGWPHHVATNWRRRDGCARAGVVGPGVVVTPPVVVVPARRWCHRPLTSNNFRC